MGRQAPRAELAKLAAAAVALLAWMAFIFYMSAKTGGSSGGMSESVASWLAQLLCPGWADMPEGARAELLAAMSLPVRKGAHVTEYAVLAVLAFVVLSQARAVRRLRAGEGAAVGAAGEDGLADEGRARPASATWPAGRPVLPIALAAFAFSVLYAASDEFHQLFVPGRAGLFTDVAIDSCGAAAGAVLAACVACARRRKRGI